MSGDDFGLVIKATATVVREYVAGQIAELTKRLTAIEERPIVHGRDGAPGPQGEKGLPGDPGLRGEIGSQGPIGESGTPGRDGQRGSAISCSHGPPIDQMDQAIANDIHLDLSTGDVYRWV